MSRRIAARPAGRRVVQEGRRKRELESVEEMQHKLADELIREIAPVAMARVRALITSEDERVAVAAIKLVLDKAIATPKPQEVGDGEPADLERMSQAQLAETIRRLEQELSTRAKDITPDLSFME